MNEKEFEDLVGELLSYGRENEWIEFKKDNFEPHLIGEHIPAWA